MGAGKSTVGSRLARELDWVFVDLDEEIVRAEGKSIAAIFDSASDSDSTHVDEAANDSTMGEARFREIENVALASNLKRSDIVLALGGGAIETAANRQLLLGDPETLLLYLEAPLDVMIERCEDQHREQAGVARRPVLEKKAEIAARFLRRKPLYESSHWTIGTAELGLDEIVRRIVLRWKEYILEPSEQTTVDR